MHHEKKPETNKKTDPLKSKKPYSSPQIQSESILEASLKVSCNGSPADGTRKEATPLCQSNSKKT